MANFDYKKWVTENKYGKPLFEQATGSYTGSGTGSATGSGTGSGGPSTGGNTPTGSAGGCIINTQAQGLVDQNPHMGSYGISQQFINNMAGKPNSFYNHKISKFNNKIYSLRTNFPSQGGYLGFCQGENPNWQAQLTNKWGYVQNCKNNPGTC